MLYMLCMTSIGIVLLEVDVLRQFVSTRILAYARPNQKVVQTFFEFANLSLYQYRQNFAVYERTLAVTELCGNEGINESPVT